MGTSIREGISDLERRLKAELAIAERFPDAYLRDVGDSTFWMSANAAPHTTHIDLVQMPKRDGVYVYTYLLVEDMRVYAEQCGTTYAGVWLDVLREEHPEVFATMLSRAR